MAGTYYSSVPFYAVLYQNGTLKNLNDLIPSSSSVVLEAADAIINNGQILAGGIGSDGRYDAFLLTPAGEPAPAAPQIPTPEPSLLAFFAMAAAGVALRRAWKLRRA